jgi:UDP-glucose 4-epimerase
MRGDPITIFGTDYDTPDGTCIRDFVHVEDLMTAHLAALVYLDTHADSICLAINVGSGKGSSVREVIGAVEKVVGKPLQVRIEPRRPGDPPRLVAESALARQLLGWQPTQGLEAMIRSHLQWETRREKAR